MGIDESLFYKPGYVPTQDDVTAYIEEHGQWGSLPKINLCPECMFPRTPGEDCVACNAKADSDAV